MFKKKRVKNDTKKITSKTYQSYTLYKKQYINLKNPKNRLEFAKQFVDKALDFWRKVIIFDESKYKIFSTDVRQRVWRKPGEAPNPKKTVKHCGGGLMV